MEMAIERADPSPAHGRAVMAYHGRELREVVVDQTKAQNETRWQGSLVMPMSHCQTLHPIHSSKEWGYEPLDVDRWQRQRLCQRDT